MKYLRPLGRKTSSSSGSSTGTAGGDLVGSYPSPTLVNTGITAGTYTKLTVDTKGRSITGALLTASDIPVLDAAAIATGTFNISRIPTGSTASTVTLGNDSRLSDSRSPSGSAGGDLIGSYPSPTLALSGVTAGTYTKVTVDSKGRVTSGTTLSSGDVPGGGTSSGTAGGDLTGTYPSPTLVASGITAGTYTKLTIDAKGRATVGALLAASDIPALSTAAITSGTFSLSRLPTGTTTGTLALGDDTRFTDSRIPTGTAAGDLAGTYPSPTLTSTGVVAGTYTKLTVDSKGRVTAGTTLSSGDIPGGGTSSGTAGGDLTGTYPSPTLVASGITAGTYTKLTIDTKGRATVGALLSTSDIPALSTAAITSGTFSLSRLPTGTTTGTLALGDDARFTDSRAPSGAAGGDLAGTYPSPTLTTTGITAGSYFKVTVDTKGRVTAGAQLAASDIPALSAAAITSGTFSLSRLPTGTTTGTLALGDDARFTDSRTPSGAAGGDLTGSFPSPTLTTTGITAGSYFKVTVDTKGRVTAGAQIAASDIPALSAAAITSGTFSLSRLPTGTTTGTLALGDDARFTDSRAPSGAAGGDLAGTFPSPTLVVSGVTAGTYPKVTVDSKGRVTVGSTLVAADIPALDATAIATGTLGIARIPTGTTATTVTLGNDSRLSDARTPTGAAGGDLTGTFPNPTLVVSGVTAGTYPKVTVDSKGRVTTGSSLAASDMPAHSAALLTSGTLDIARIPTGTTATTVTLGNDSRLSDARTPAGAAGGDLTGTYPSPTLVVSGVVAGTYPKVTVDSKGRVTVGSTLVAADIPALDAAAIATGILGIARIPTGTSATTVTLGNDSRLSDARTPTGAAGGDLTGTYPSPTLAVTGVVAGTYPKVTVDSKGRITTGSSLAAGDIPSHDASLLATGTVAIARLPVGSTSSNVCAGDDSRLQLQHSSDLIWQDFTFAANWSNYGSPYASARFTKNQYGVVFIKGLIKKSTTTTGGEIIVSGLPISCRPSEIEPNPAFEYSTASSSYKVSSFFVENASGNITYAGSTGNTVSYLTFTTSYFVEQKTAVFFGDSITYGVGASDNSKRWSTLLATALGVREDNRGISGTVLQSTDSLANNGIGRYNTDVLKPLPDLVYILYGLNDLRYNSANFTTTTYQTALDSLIQGILPYVKTPGNIIIGSPPFMNPSSFSSYSPYNAGSTVKQEQYRDITKVIAAKYRCKWVDIYAAMRDGGGISLVSSSDGIHPNDTGHAFVKTTFLTATYV